MSDQLPSQNFSRRRFWNGVYKRHTPYLLVWCDLQEEMHYLRTLTNAAKCPLPTAEKAGYYCITAEELKDKNGICSRFSPRFLIMGLG